MDNSEKLWAKELESRINSLKHKTMNNLLDLDHWRGAEIANNIYAASEESRWMNAVYLLKPRLEKDGNQWCCILGDLPEPNCIAGFGDSPILAMAAFHSELHKSLKTQTNG